MKMGPRSDQTTTGPWHVHPTEEGGCHMASYNKSRRRKVGTKTKLRDGTIRVTVQHGYRADGTPRRLHAYAKTDSEAERVAMELASKLGRSPELGKGITLARWWEAYKATRGKRIKKVTLDRYATEMRNTWIPALGDKDITFITHADIQEVLLRAKTHSMAHEREKALSAVLTHAVREGYLGDNPCRNTHFEMPGDVGRDVPADIAESDDPFAAIEMARQVWDAATVLAAWERLRGLPIETCWLCMIGAGLRREEALALRWKDVRRQNVLGVERTELAVHSSNTAVDGMGSTKTRGSVRIVSVIEPFGARLWELRGAKDDLICELSPKNIHRRWKKMWEKPSADRKAKHIPKDPATPITLGVMLREPEVPFIHLKQMRATHTTLAQAAGVPDSLNAAMHGHSQRVEYSHYLKPDTAEASARMGELFLLEGGVSTAG